MYAEDLARRLINALRASETGRIATLHGSGLLMELRLEGEWVVIWWRGLDISYPAWRFPYVFDEFLAFAENFGLQTKEGAMEEFNLLLQTRPEPSGS